MTYGYKAHSVLQTILKPRLNLRTFLLTLSWRYAHYQNPEFVVNYGWTPTRNSFWHEVKTSWVTSRHSEYGGDGM